MDIPQGIDSKFRFILVAAKRARQLQAGAKPLVQTPYKKATKVSVAELSAGLVPVEFPEFKPSSSEKASEAKK
ncbi:MAG TPA: DNA-directed RNA polymerase subunit omega [Terriglobia bacterium]|nr:DNA-directed RNA polymerase subunit omega [Terriglobia bacterium]